ncbi:unnamed protein product, partial [marine sediment metagenome]
RPEFALVTVLIAAFSCLTKPLTVLTKFGIKSARLFN